MGPLILIVQIVVALGLLNVWLIRANRRTAYRGGDARNMREEFAAYGLPPWMFVVIGTLKVGVAIALLAGLWYHALVLPAALVLCALMIGALAMHVKIHDPLRKAAPAASMFALAAIIAVGSVHG
jgi:hypothetical protein